MHHLTLSDGQLLATYGPWLDQLFASAGPDVIRSRIGSFLNTFVGNREALRAQPRLRTKQPAELSPELQAIVDRIGAEFAAGLGASVDRFKQRAASHADALLNTYASAVQADDVFFDQVASAEMDRLCSLAE